MKLKVRILTVCLVLLLLNALAIFVIVYIKEETDIKSMSYGNYGITVYYKGGGEYKLDLKENRLILSVNNAEIASENDGLFYKKDGIEINLCETGHKAFTIDEQGNLID